ADELTLHEIKPYFMGKFGAFNLEAQLHYQTGDIDYVSASKASLDLSGLAYNLEGKLNLGPVTVEAGYAFRSGDDQGTSDEFEKYVLGQQNRNIKQNWSLLHILTNDDGDFGDLGGNGNFSRNRGGTDNGYKIIYAGLHFKPLKDLVAGMRFGFATADQVAKGQDDQIGVETDIFFTYRMYKNLTYDFVFAWLNSGDYWREWQPGKKAPEDLFSTMQVLKLKF
ncbi:MAG: hypothetical protein Q8P24_00650, partial [Desulfobacterales bacterium]|nr:hypothetical protein [Desulfobacterales bacterium]